MGNAIQTRAEIPAPTPQITQSLTPQERLDHRARIAFDVEVILSGYWQASPSEQIKTGILADWMDALEDWSHEQVVYALRKWRNDFPDKRPNPGHILAMMKDLRGRRIAKAKPTTPELPRKKLSADRAAEIMQEVGFRPKGFGGAS